jgi:hypothetical protein
MWDRIGITLEPSYACEGATKKLVPKSLQVVLRPYFIEVGLSTVEQEDRFLLGPLARLLSPADDSRPQQPGGGRHSDADGQLQWERDQLQHHLPAALPLPARAQCQGAGHARAPRHLPHGLPGLQPRQGARVRRARQPANGPQHPESGDEGRQPVRARSVGRFGDGRKVWGERAALVRAGVGGPVGRVEAEVPRDVWAQRIQRMGAAAGTELSATREGTRELGVSTSRRSKHARGDRATGAKWVPRASIF